LSSTFPPPFEARAPDGTSVLVDDVDVLLKLIAQHAGVPLRRLDRRTFESTLATLDVPKLHAERALMVFVGRKRQARLASVHAGVGRIRVFATILVVLLVAVVYGYRLDKRLASKLDRARASQVVYVRDRHVATVALVQLEASGLDARERESLEVALDAAEDRAASSRRRYDALANDYDSAIRGFPTAPFARLVSLPKRVPMSWELPRDSGTR
jgi:hypothetical protein